MMTVAVISIEKSCVEFCFEKVKRAIIRCSVRCFFFEVYRQIYVSEAEFARIPSED